MSMVNSVQSRLGYGLKIAQHALRKRMEADLRPLGLTLPQYAVLVELENNTGQTNADLAVKAFITPQSMQGVLVNMEAAGLIERKPDMHHGRRQLAQLTTKGAALAARGHAVTLAVENAMRDAVAPLSPEQASALFDRLRGAARDIEG